MMRAAHVLPPYAPRVPFQPLCGPVPFPGSPASSFRGGRGTQRFSPVSAAVVMHQPHEIPTHERNTP